MKKMVFCFAIRLIYCNFVRTNLKHDEQHQANRIDWWSLCW